MAILLDTQVLIWLEEEPEKVKWAVKQKIAREEEVYFSLVSVWEMAIKLKLRKLSLKKPLHAFVAGLTRAYNFEILYPTKEHVYYTQQLPMHHKDPFDRLIIAQSLVENMEVVTADEIFETYGVKRFW